MTSMKVLIRREWPVIVPIAGMFLATAIAWSRVEPPIPTHWNWRGEVDGTGSRLSGLLLVPCIALGLSVLLAWIPRIDPARANYASFASAYRTIRVAFAAWMALMQGLVITAATGTDVQMERVMPVMMGGLFIVLGNVMGKLRPNYFAGVRTPWTLASARSWTVTHLWAGRVFTASGLGLLLGGAAGMAWLVLGAFIGLGVGLVASVVLSFVVWRHDPDRTPATAVRPDED